MDWNKETIKYARLSRKLSQSQFASALGVSKSTVEKWEQGLRPVTPHMARYLDLFFKTH